MLDRIYQDPFPTLSVTDTYVLRELKDADSEPYYAYYQDPEVGHYILATDPRTPAEARAEILYCRNLFRGKRGFYWALANKESDEMIGAVGLYTNNFHHRAEICYDLNRDYWRQGIMSAAIQATLAYCFRVANMERIEAVTMLENEASQNILIKSGFEYEGILKSYRYYEGRFYDVHMYGMNRPMYDALHPEEKSNLDTMMDEMGG